MASNAQFLDRNHFGSNDNHSRVIHLVWLDANSAKSSDVGKKLRSIVNRFIKFQDMRKCQQYIETQSHEDRLILIVSGRLGREIVPSIYQLQHIISIYVFCMDRDGNKQWADKFSKVKAVIVELDELITCIESDYRLQKMVDEQLLITCLASDDSTATENNIFVFYQFLIAYLLQMKPSEKDKKELIRHCKKQYGHNSEELSNIRDFEKNYSPDQAIWWYTRDSFLSKTLHMALHIQDLHLICLFRMFIIDIHRQLQNDRVKSNLQVYRGYLMPSDQLRTLSRSCGQLISMNCFFSANIDYHKVFSFLCTICETNSLEPVLFVIDADPKITLAKPFANISAYNTDSNNNAEILFMIGSIFRLNSIDRTGNDRISIIRMTLCEEMDHQLAAVLMNTKQHLKNQELDLQTLEELLGKISQDRLVRQNPIRASEEISSNDHSFVNVLEDLGNRNIKDNRKPHDSKSAIGMLDIKDFNLQKGTNVLPIIPADAQWEHKATTIAGTNERGDAMNQLSWPTTVFMNDDEAETIVIADQCNHRIVQWRKNDKYGDVVVGNGRGHELSRLNSLVDVLIDKQTNSFIIADRGNKRVVRWSRRKGTHQGEILIDNIKCWKLFLDEHRNLYVTDTERDEVRRYKIDAGDKTGTVVAGGNGNGSNLNQLNYPAYIFVDQQQAVYVSDHFNHRIMKWDKGATVGILVAGGRGYGDDPAQVSYPRGLYVDSLGTVYVVEERHNRVVRWPHGAAKGDVIAGRHRRGNEAKHLDQPIGLSFDKYGHLYVVDSNNHRIQRFARK